MRCARQTAPVKAATSLAAALDRSWFKLPFHTVQQCQENYAYHQRESVDHGMFVAIANYLHNLWVKAFDRVETSSYFLDDLFCLFTATKSVFQAASQRLLNDG